MFLEILQNSQESTCARVSLLINFIKKETLAQVYSCEFCKISKNTFFSEHLQTTASVNFRLRLIGRDTKCFQARYNIYLSSLIRNNLVTITIIGVCIDPFCHLLILNSTWKNVACFWCSCWLQYKANLKQTLSLLPRFWYITPV